MISYEIINFLFFIKNPKIFLFLLFLQHFSLKSRSYLFFIFRKTFGNPIFFLTQKKSRPPNNTSESLDFITFFKLFAMSCFLVFYVYDFSLIVASASLAYSMRHHQGSALAALYQIWCAHLPVCSTAISSCFRRFILWTNRHGLHLLQLLKNILDN